MNGLVNIFFPLFNAADRWVSALGLGPVPRMGMWGIVSGATAVGLYALLSNQARIRSKKATICSFREKIREFDGGDLGEVLRLSRQNVAHSCGLLALVVLPTVGAAIPVIAVLCWVETTFAYASLRPGDTVAVTFAPRTANVRVHPGDAGRWVRPGTMDLVVPAGHAVRFEDASGVVLFDNTLSTPASPVIQPYRWWNVLIGNEAGYLPADTAVDEIRFHFRRRTILQGMPRWLSTWEFPYFLAMTVTALSLRFG
ncbi:MAG: hypothetical protein ACC628_15470, partial [Pirellulaceae bacterium]